MPKVRKAKVTVIAERQMHNLRKTDKKSQIASHIRFEDMNMAGQALMPGMMKR